MSLVVASPTWRNVRLESVNAPNTDIDKPLPSDHVYQCAAWSRSPKIALPTRTGRAHGDRHRVIRAHPHRQQLQAVARYDL
jgi:hypothetical protein